MGNPFTLQRSAPAGDQSSPGQPSDQDGLGQTHAGPDQAAKGSRLFAESALPVEARQALHIDGSKANYWEIDERVLSNMQWTCTPLDPSVPVFREPHACVTGTVQKVIHEADGDIHFWLELDGSKQQLACEIIPQNPLTPPKVNDHVQVFGILRYDLQHKWQELHPVDAIRPV